MNNAKEINLKGVHIGVPPVVLRLYLTRQPNSDMMGISSDRA